MADVVCAHVSAVVAFLELKVAHGTLKVVLPVDQRHYPRAAVIFDWYRCWTPTASTRKHDCRAVYSRFWYRDSSATPATDLFSTCKHRVRSFIHLVLSVVPTASTWSTGDWTTRH